MKTQNQLKESSEDEVSDKVDEEVVIPLTLAPPTVGKHHNWKQQGPYLNCFQCESPHGFHIGINKIFKGYSEDGTLIIENR